MIDYVSLIDAETGYGLDIRKDWEDRHYCIELYNEEKFLLFHHICDTFTTGNFLSHLQKGIKRYFKTGHKIIVSRWYPYVDRKLLMSIEGFPYISTTIFKDEDKIEKIKFMVFTEEHKLPYIFLTPIKNIQEKLFIF